MDAIVLSARDSLTRHARTFRMAARFLPRDVRDDVAVVYALCRSIDDAADERASAEELAELDEEIAGTRPPRPLVRAFLDVSARRGVPIAAARELVLGCRSDLGVVRIADERARVRYCYHLAGTVGLMMAPLLGARTRDALAHARDLGIAMQMTNIARDVAEDAARDRVYLPATWLGDEHAGSTSFRDRDHVHAVVRRLVSLAEVYYRSGELGLRALRPRARVAVAVAARVYRAIGLAVVRRGPAALATRTVLSSIERFASALDGLRLAALAPTLPVLAHMPAEEQR
jgi:phytoene synthase